MAPNFSEVFLNKSSVFRFFFPQKCTIQHLISFILLMKEIPNNHLGCFSYIPCKYYQPQVVHRISSIAEFGARLLQCCSLWCCMVKWCSQTGGESIEKVTWRTSFEEEISFSIKPCVDSTRILKWMSDGMKWYNFKIAKPRSYIFQ